MRDSLFDILLSPGEIDNPFFSGAFAVSLGFVPRVCGSKICLCFLFVINGANLIDGFNGLLTLNINELGSKLSTSEISKYAINVLYVKA